MHKILGLDDSHADVFRASEIDTGLYSAFH